MLNFMKQSTRLAGSGYELSVKLYEIEYLSGLVLDMS